MPLPLAQRCALVCAAFAIAACMACGGNSDSTTPTATATNGTSSVASSSTSTTASTATTGATATSAASTAASQSPTAAPTAANQVSAIQVVLNYYRAINSKDYSTAYGLWASNGAASNQTAAEFAKGFANTVRVDANLGQPAAEAAA